MAIRSPRILSICTGAGGLDLGVRLARPDARTVCYVEREAFAVANLVAAIQGGLMDEAPVWSDLATFDGVPWRGRVDWLIGGIPCQPHSTAGQRQGADDERDLWPDAARIIREVRPGIVFLENVPGIMGYYHERIGPELRGMGYATEEGLFSAAEVGAPHARERFFVLGSEAVANAHDGARSPEHEHEHEEWAREFGGSGPGAVGDSECSERRPGGPPFQRLAQPGTNVTTYGYVRTSVAGSDPESQALQLRGAGVEPTNIFRDLAVSGRVGAASREGWHSLDGRMAAGDTLTVVSIDRIGRRWLDTVTALTDLRTRGVRILTLAENEAVWAAYLSADPDTPEAFIGHMLASFAAWVAAQEIESISRRTKAGLERARAAGTKLGRPRVMSDEQISAAEFLRSTTHSDRAIARLMGVDARTVRNMLGKVEGGR